MNKVNRFLLMLIAMAAIMLLAVGVDKGMKFYEHKKWESEREAYYEQARTDIAKMQMTLQTLSEDQEALVNYLQEYEMSGQTGDTAASLTEDQEAFPVIAESAVPENTASGNDVSENMLPESAISEDMVSENTASGNSISGNTASENSISGNTVSENSISGNTTSGNGISGNTVSGDSVSGASVSGNRLPDISGNGLQTEISASYEATIRANREDKKTIAESSIDFSGKKIACLGDSITAATNLEGQENYEEMSYPYQLGEIVNAGEVVNLGIGGSSIGRYWENAFVDRYREIPADSDIIIVMGGTNDGFCASERELGSLEKREKKTFAGDLDELLTGLKENYPDAEIVLVTPLPTILQDMLRRNRQDLLPQSSFVAVMRQLAAEHEIPVIDLYDSGILDSHDAAVIHSFLPDGVHGNEMGYRYLAEHIAAELIRMEQSGMEDKTEEARADG